MRTTNNIHKEKFKIPLPSDICELEKLQAVEARRGDQELARIELNYLNKLRREAMVV